MAVRNTNVKQTETLKELIYIPEEGVCINMCDLGKKVFTVSDEQVSSLQGHSCQGIRMNMTKRHRGEGAVDRLEKEPCLPQLGLP